MLQAEPLRRPVSGRPVLPDRQGVKRIGTTLASAATAAPYNRTFDSLAFPGRSVLQKFWLLFAQACTLCLAALFVVVTLRPDLLSRPAGRAESVILTQEATTSVVPLCSWFSELPP